MCPPCNGLEYHDAPDAAAEPMQTPKVYSVLGRARVDWRVIADLAVIQLAGSNNITPHRNTHFGQFDKSTPNVSRATVGKV